MDADVGDMRALHGLFFDSVSDLRAANGCQSAGGVCLAPGHGVQVSLVERITKVYNVALSLRGAAD